MPVFNQKELIMGRIAIFVLVLLSGCISAKYTLKENVSVKEDFTLPRPKPVATAGIEFIEEW